MQANGCAAVPLARADVEQPSHLHDAPSSVYKSAIEVSEVTPSSSADCARRAPPACPAVAAPSPGAAAQLLKHERMLAAIVVFLCVCFSQEPGVLICAAPCAGASR
jgi:hypothetical protein